MRQVLTIAASPLSSAGLGLLMWSGMTTALLQVRLEGASTLQQLQLIGVLIGSAFLTCGMLMRHFAPAQLPAPPTRRARLLVWATLGIALALCVLLLTGAGMRQVGLPRALGVGLLLAAFGSVTALTSDYARLPSPPAWQQPLVLPVQLLLAMSTGLALLYVLMDRMLVSGSDGRTMLATLSGLGACAALCKGVYWRAIDRLPTAGAAPRTFPGARLLVLGLAAGAPLLGWLLATAGNLPVWILLLMAAIGLFAASILEHRLFLQEGAASTGTPGSAS